MLRKSRIMQWLILFIYIIFSSMGMVLIKKGGANTGVQIEKSGAGIQFSWIFLLGLILYLLSFILWMYILKMFTVTYISPVAYGIVYIMLLILSRVILAEYVSLKQIIGSTLIIIGITIASI